MERPILFSGEMVRAILEGRKTQTRRIVKNLVNTVVGTEYSFHETKDGIWEVGFDYGNGMGDFLRYINCPYGKPGDRLWVRETWVFRGTDMSRLGRSHLHQDVVVQYPANKWNEIIEIDCLEAEKWMKRGNKNHSSIHMPRWASRILLEVVSVRVERLKEISLADINAEGTPYTLHRDKRPYGSRREHFQRLWDSINGNHQWVFNPWVWVIEFRKVD